MSTRNQAWLLPADTSEPELRQGISMRSVLGVLRRRRLLFLAPALALTAVGVAVALLLPARYRAQAVLRVEPAVLRGSQPEITPENSETQLSRIYEVVHRRYLLETLAQEFKGLGGEDGAPMGEAELAELRGRVRAGLEGPRTFSLAFDDSSPERAKDVVARIVELLVATSQAERERDAKATAGFVEEQLAQLSTQIREHERKIEQYKRSAFDQLPEQMPTLLGQIKSVEEQIQETAATTAELESKRGAIQRQLNELEQYGYSKEPAQAGADQLRLELAQLRRRYTDQHPEVQRVQAELQALEQSITERRATVAAPEMTPSRLRVLQLTGELQDVEAQLARTAVRRNSLAAQAGGYRGRLAAAPGHEMAISSMAREYEADKAQYQSLLDELHDARLTERLEEASQGVFRVVEAPRIPTEPFAPQRFRIALLGLLAGLGVGLAAAFLAEQADTSIQTVEELEMPSSLPVLASIPSLTAVKSSPALLAVNPRAARGVSLLDEPFGAVAEQYRILATKLINRAANGNGHSGNGNGHLPESTAMLITSAGAGEGKTTAAVNVALALAKMMPDEAVLLVDADLGRPAVHRMLDLPAAPGLAELLANPDDEPGKYIRALHGLFVLPAGEYAFEARSVWSSPLAGRVLQSLRRRFRYVIVDSPPILAVAEGLILQEVVDSVLLVVRARVTPRELIRRSLASLDLSRLAGVVLTDVQGITEAYTYPYFDPAQQAAHARGGSPW